MKVAVKVAVIVIAVGVAGALGCASKKNDLDTFSASMEQGGTSKACSYGAITQKNFFAYQVDKKAELQSGSPMPRYPQALKESGLMGEVVARFAVDTTGHIDKCTFRVLETSHKQFSRAVEQVLDDIRFTPAEIRGQKVRQVVEHRFTFELKDTE
jgi:TonB family protein